jgi:hypothetical protein
MGLDQYSIVAQGDEWGVLHDGNVKNRYATKESAFEAAVAAASLAIREGHEVHYQRPQSFSRKPNRPRRKGGHIVTLPAGNLRPASGSNISRAVRR